MTTQDKNAPGSNDERERVALLQGTLDLLILQTLAPGPHHGQGIARTIQRQSNEALFVDHGSLYLALQRLEDKGWVSAKWGISENNRKARFYTLTIKGRAELSSRTKHWHRLSKAIGLILNPQE
jgi:PadR family transcriptional regulator